MTSKCGIGYEKFKQKLVEKLNEYFRGTSISDEKEEKIKIQLENEKITLNIPFKWIEEIYYSSVDGERAAKMIINLSEENFIEELKRRIRKNKNVD